jgi:SPP1 gp7 family putative phage head morphogenesis protein
MTTPTVPPQQAQPQQQDAPSDTALIAAIIAAFLAAHTVSAIVSRLRKPFARSGISASAMKAGVAVVLAMPEQPAEGIGPATMWTVRVNTLRRAAFTLASVRRIQKAADDARAQGEPVIDAIRAAVQTERRYFTQHVHASQKRIAATSAVDGMAAIHGNLLGWRTVVDEATTPGCLAADGKSFRVDDPPVVEGQPNFPGTVHPRCRCRPMPPRPGAPVMPGAGGR